MLKFVQKWNLTFPFLFWQLGMEECQWAPLTNFIFEAQNYPQNKNSLKLIWNCLISKYQVFIWNVGYFVSKNVLLYGKKQ